MIPRVRDGTVVIAYHKPKGLVTTHKDEHGRETVYDRLVPRLPPELRRLSWHAVGRLDKDTAGLLLFTNDGAFVSHATQPRTHLKKIYLVLAKGLLDEEALEPLRKGVELTGGLGRSAPAKVELLGHGIATSWLSLEIEEGKNREVRRMLLAIESQAIRLTRVQIGTLALDLEEDEWRRLSAREVREKLGYSP
jgi:23S rRNA pseudouridine2605 synthase/16S rRNA pseudouridine516 synthase